MSETLYRVRTHTIATKWGLLCNNLTFSSPSAKSEHLTYTYRLRTNTLSYIASCSTQNVDTQLYNQLSHILRTLTVTPMLMSETLYRVRTHTIATKWGLLCNNLTFSSPFAKSEHFTYTYRPRTNTLSYIASCSAQNVDTQLYNKLSTYWGLQQLL